MFIAEHIVVAMPSGVRNYRTPRRWPVTEPPPVRGLVTVYDIGLRGSFTVNNSP